MNLDSHLLVQHYFILFETDTSRRKFLFFVPRLSQDEETFYSSFSSNFLYRFDCVLTIVPRFLPSFLKMACYFRSRLGVIMVHMTRMPISNNSTTFYTVFIFFKCSTNWATDKFWVSCAILDSSLASVLFYARISKVESVLWELCMESARQSNRESWLDICACYAT